MNIVINAKQIWNKFWKGYRQVYGTDSFQEHNTTLNNLQARLKKSNDDLNKIISES